MADLLYHTAQLTGFAVSAALLLHVYKTNKQEIR